MKFSFEYEHALTAGGGCAFTMEGWATILVESNGEWYADEIFISTATHQPVRGGGFETKWHDERLSVKNLLYPLVLHWIEDECSQQVHEELVSSGFLLISDPHSEHRLRKHQLV